MRSRITRLRSQPRTTHTIARCKGKEKEMREYTGEGDHARQVEPEGQDMPMDTFSAAMIADGEWELAGFEPSVENYHAAYQHLIDTGAAWTLQGRIGRTAMDLINAGDCHAAR